MYIHISYSKILNRLLLNVGLRLKFSKNIRHILQYILSFFFLRTLYVIVNNVQNFNLMFTLNNNPNKIQIGIIFFITSKLHKQFY